MPVIVFVFVLIFTEVLAQTQLGESCGDNIGEITLVNKCTTAITVSKVTTDKDSNLVCCIKSSYLEQSNKPMRKSEEACIKFGPGIRRNLSSSDDEQPGDYQHNIALDYAFGDQLVGSGTCNGVLINEKFVLTTADCADSKWPYPLSKVRAGTTDFSGETDTAITQQIQISQIIIHPEYDEDNFIHNLALLRLAESVKFTSRVQPACLYTKNDVPAMMNATGWGLKSNDDTKLSKLLLSSNVIKLNAERCNNSVLKSVYDSEFCGVTDSNICDIGSGSPVFLRNKEDGRVTLIAIHSYGVLCDVASVFIKIANYLDWIESIVWP